MSAARLPKLKQPEPISALRQWRIAAGLTLVQVVAQTGVSIGTISRVERGDKPSALTAERLRQLGYPL